MGAGGRLDIPCNLVSLGSSQLMACPCHHDHHSIGEPSADDLLAIACQREGLMQDDARALIHFLRRLSRKDTQSEVERKLADVHGSARSLCRRFLREHRSKAS